MTDCKVIGTVGVARGNRARNRRKTPKYGTKLRRSDTFDAKLCRSCGAYTLYATFSRRFRFAPPTVIIVSPLRGCKK